MIFFQKNFLSPRFRGGKVPKAPYLIGFYHGGGFEIPNEVIGG